MFVLSRTRGRIVGFVVLFAFIALLGVTLMKPNAVNAQTSPSLGTAASFAVLAGSEVTNSGATTVNGWLGVSPGTSITGAPQVTGETHAGDPVALQAQNDVIFAYDNLAGQACNTNLTGQDLGLLPPLTPGVYCFSSTAQLTGTLTLDAGGNPDAVFVFQVASALNTSTDSSVLVVNGGTGCNVWWQVGTTASLGTRTLFQGNILALTSVTLGTEATLVPGRVIARNAEVTLLSNTISPAACTVAPLFTPTNTLVPTDVPTDTPTNTLVPTNTPTNTLIPTDTLVPTNTPTVTGTLSATPTGTLSATPTDTATPTPTNAPATATAFPVLANTVFPTQTATQGSSGQRGSNTQAAVQGLPNTGGGPPQATYWMDDTRP
jgi:type VI secretion system secreted protein VgrG